LEPLHEKQPLQFAKNVFLVSIPIKKDRHNANCAQLENFSHKSRTIHALRAQLDSSNQCVLKAFVFLAIGENFKQK
jgi:hypothetical protein